MGAESPAGVAGVNAANADIVQGARLLTELQALGAQAEALLRSSPGEAHVLSLQIIERGTAAALDEIIPLARFIAGTALSLLTEFEGARTMLERAAREAEREGQERVANRCMNGLAVIYEFTGEFGRGLQMLEKCLVVARQSGDVGAEVRAHCNLGNIYVAMKEFDRAHELFRHGMVLCETHDNSLLWVIMAGSFAESLNAANQIEEAEALLERFLPMAEQQGHRLQLGFLLKIRATNLVARNSLDEARVVLLRAEVIARDVGDRNLLCDVLLCLAETAVHMGDYARAQAILSEVVPLAGEVKLRLYEVRAHALEARVAAEQREYQRAYGALCREIEVERALAAETTSRKTQVLTVEFELERHRQTVAAERERSALLDVSNQRLNEANRKLQRALDQLEHTASHDAITGLLNRWKFQELAEAALKSATQGPEYCALCFIDLNDFKRVNDSLGHDAGDTLLAEVARRLKQTLRGCDVVARLGGDEFVVLLRELGGPQQIDAIVGKIRGAWSAPFDLGQPHTASASIGVAVWPRDGVTLAELQKRADERMYEEKLARPNRRRGSHSR